MRLGVLRLSSEELERYRDQCGFASASAALYAMAEALAGQELLPPGVPFTMAGRVDPEPLLALVGEWQDEAARRLHLQARVLGGSCLSLRYATDEQVRSDVEALAAALELSLGRAELARCRFVGIPRGGTIVLGWLAYALGLDAVQVALPGSPVGERWIAVDDCALTGSRFERFVAGFDRPPVAFVHLYSAPPLRQALEASSANGLLCVAAADLAELADRWPAHKLEQWRLSWPETLRVRPWVGAVEAPCFPWAEPDRLLWDPEAEEVVRAWRLVPASRCLGNRRRSANTAGTVFEPPAAGGLLEMTDRGLWCLHRGKVVLADLGGDPEDGSAEGGRCWELDPVATAMWTAAWENRSRQAVAAAVAERFDVVPERALADAQQLFSDLAERGLVRWRG